MSEFDANLYNDLYSRVERQIKVQRTIIDALESRQNERHWMKHQTSGDFDDGKIIEGLAGDKNIYRKRAEESPGVHQNKPKRIRFCFDVSGSMYRFNGYDHRLQRSIESALLVMESFKDKNDKIKVNAYIRIEMPCA